MRRNIDMKKKIIIPLSIIVLVFLVANIVTYAYSNENLFEFFFADNNAVQKKITNNLLTKEKQKIEIDNYIIKLEEGLCEKKTQLGYLVISVSDKNGNKVDADIDKKNNTIKSFGKDNRFTFEYEATGTFTKYAEYKGNKLYIYIYFEINNEISKDTDLNKCIKITDNGEKINNEYKQYNFYLKFDENCKKFKSKSVRNITSTVTGTILGTTANTVLLQTYDGVKILCSRENVPDLSSSGMEEGADLRVTFNPAKSRTSNIYTCIKFEDP